MNSRARAKVLFRICEEVVRACADEEGSADFGVCERQLGVSGGGAGAHELLYDLYIRSYFLSRQKPRAKRILSERVNFQETYQAASFAPLP